MFGPGSHEEVQNLLPRLAHRGPDDQRIIGTEEKSNVKRISVAEDQWQNTLLEYFRWDVKLTSTES